MSHYDILLAKQLSGGGGGGTNKLPQVIDGSVTELTAADFGGVTSIRSYGFFGCISLTSVTFPKSISIINSYAFFGCSGLKSITSLNTQPPMITSTTFNGVPADCAIYVPAESVDTYKAADYWNVRADYIQAIPEE